MEKTPGNGVKEKQERMKHTGNSRKDSTKYNKRIDIKHYLTLH